MKPLEGMIVLDFAQFLAGPSAALRLHDMGARVIKVERPDGGDNERRLTFDNIMIDGDALTFQNVNRGKESFTVNLKEQYDLECTKKLIEKADVLIDNFRPGVMEKIGLDYASVQKINPRIVYGKVTGYGEKGQWVKKPGQDLLLQSISGCTWLNGDGDMPPTPLALSLIDSITGTHLVEGILACLLRRGKTGEGGKVEVSLLESVLDFQLEFVTEYLNNGRKLPERAFYRNVNCLNGAPAGIYEAADGYVAIGDTPVENIGKAFGIAELAKELSEKEAFEKRDDIKRCINSALKCKNTEDICKTLCDEKIPHQKVCNWDDLVDSEIFKKLTPIINIKRPNSGDIPALGCPIRIGGKSLAESVWAPPLGQDRIKIMSELGLQLKEGEMA